MRRSESKIDCNRMSQNKSIDDYRTLISNDFLYFVKLFYKLRTHREFVISEPISRQSHHLVMAQKLTDIYNGKCKRLLINIPPRYGKSEMLIHFVAWAMGLYPDSNFIYTSYSHSIAKKQTQTIRNIIEMEEYKEIFHVTLADDATAKDNFETNYGGSVFAAGAGGSITGRGAGIFGSKRFSGCIVIDDIHKPSEISSDTMREEVHTWYYETLQSRVNSPDTPIIFIGQRLHEDDLPARLIKNEEWDKIILPALDGADNALNPQMHDVKTLKRMREIMPYDFASQYQQDPQPAGGGIFQKSWFLLFEDEPRIIETFITVDTAETDKDYNDATVFSFWGMYKIKHQDFETEEFALHWMNCWELRIEPKDIENEFFNFYRICMAHKVKPKIVAIEKKSTGVTLLSTLSNTPGLRTINIERTRATGSKTQRFLSIQPYVAEKRITLPAYAKHTSICIEHMRKITANDTHRFDDICDTAYDAIKLALIDKIFVKRTTKEDDAALARKVMSTSLEIDRLKKAAYYNR